MLGKWREVSPEQLLPLIGKFIHRNAKKHGVAVPNELKEYIEASVATIVSEIVASSLTVIGFSLPQSWHSQVFTL